MQNNNMEKYKLFHDFELMTIWQGLKSNENFNKIIGQNLHWQNNLINEIETELTNRNNKHGNIKTNN